MPGFADRVKELRKKVGLSQADLAKLIEVGKTTISNYETEYSSPDATMLKKVADVFGVSIDYLLGRTEVPVEEPYTSSNVKKIYVVGSVRAGMPAVAVQDIVDCVFISKDKLGGHEYFGLKIKGDSMNQARICDGDTIIVRSQSYAENGDIVVALVGDEDATVKRFYKRDNIVTLMPESTNKSYMPIHIDTETTNFRIMGKLVQIIIDYN